MSFDEAEAAKRSASLPENYETELLRPFMDSLALEISRPAIFLYLHSIQPGRSDRPRRRLRGHRGSCRGRFRAHPGVVHGGEPVRWHDAVPEDPPQEPHG